MWMLDKCDAAGVIEPDYELASFQIGTPVDESTTQELGDRVQEIQGGKLWIVKFIQFQYGELSKDCKAHNPVFASIQKHFPNEKERVSKGYPKGIQRGQDTDTEKEKDKENNTEGGAGGNASADVREIPPWEHVEAFAVTIGLPPWRAEAEFNRLEGSNWIDRSGNPVRKWKPYFRLVKGWWEADGRPLTPQESKSKMNGTRRQTMADRAREITGRDEQIQLKRLA